MLVGFASAFVSGYLVDTARSQVIRSVRHELSLSFFAIPKNPLVIAFGISPFYFHLQREGGLLSMLNRRDDVDVNLLEAAFRAGRPIYLYTERAAEKVTAALGPGYVAEPVKDLPAGLYKLERSIGTDLQP
jgi:hypothetical protein